MEKEFDTIHHPLMIKTLSPLGIEVVADYIFQKWPQQYSVPPCSARACRTLYLAE